MTENGQKPVILAVDDTPENLDVVRGILASDYTVKAAINQRNQFVSRGGCFNATARAGCHSLEQAQRD